MAGEGRVVTIGARGVGTAAPLPAGRARQRNLVGYGLTAAAFVIFGAIGALVRMTTAPETVVLVIRMALAAAVLAALFARRGFFADLRRPGIAPRLLLMAALDAGTLVLFFITLRLTGVAIGMFLLFAAPVYVAVAAPRVIGQRTDRVVYGALPLALAGLALILVPGFTGDGPGVSGSGLLAGVLAGVVFACFLIVSKLLTRHVRNSTFLVTECTLDTLFILPLALWQWSGVGFELSLHDVLVSVVLGVVCTAVAYSLWIEGLRRVRVQHASILGYLEPLTAPLYALLLLGEAPTVATVAGGALIIAAGVLIVVFGAPEDAVTAEEGSPARRLHSGFAGPGMPP
jgi:drug/metabolite transporter (DMT)-like permease